MLKISEPFDGLRANGQVRATAPLVFYCLIQTLVQPFNDGFENIRNRPHMATGK